MKGSRYVMLAAEPSSDLLGAELLLALKERWSIECHALGRMALHRAKAKPLMDLEANFSRSTHALSYFHTQLLESIRRTSPRCVFFVGYQSGFAKLLERLALEGVPVVLYAPPFHSQWQDEDLAALKKYACAHVFGVFPLEEPFYAAHNVPYTYVGSPHRERTAKVSVSREVLGVPADKKLLLLLPGSRFDVFNKLMPRMLKAARLLCNSVENLQVIAPVAEGITKNNLHAMHLHEYSEVQVVERMGLEYMSAADLALTGNGTVSLECQLLKLPHVALAHSSASSNVCIQIAHQSIIPELPATAAPQVIASHLKDLLDSSSQLATMKEAMARQNTLFQPFAAEVAAQTIECLNFTGKRKGMSGA